MKRIAIVGGGISGLAAALRLNKNAAREPKSLTGYSNAARASAECSSPIASMAAWSRLVPTPFLPRNLGPATCAAKLGLGDQLIGSNDADRKTYILTRGHLVEMPDGLMFMVPTKIVPYSSIAAVLEGDQDPHGARVVSSATQSRRRRNRGRLRRTPLRSRDGRPPRRSTFVRRLWR